VTTTTATAFTRVRSSAVRVSREAASSGVFVTFLLIVALFSALRPQAYFSIDNALGILQSTAAVGILAAAVTIPLIMHEFDLTVSAVTGLAGVVVAQAITVYDTPWPFAVILTIAICALVGAVSGTIVASFPGASFIITLGLATVIGGIESWRSDGLPIFSGIPEGFTELGRGRLGRIPVVAVMLIAIAVVRWFVLARTQFGRDVHAVGGDRKAAVAAGLRVRRLVIVAFVLSGMLAGLGGLVLTAQAGAYYPAEGSLLLPIFTATFVGAAAVGGFSVPGSIFGAIYITAVTTGLQILAVAPWVSFFVQGILLLFALTLVRLGGGGAASRGALSAGRH
jgi:ribose transport system permease protein